MIKIKSGVVFKVITIEIINLLLILDEIWLSTVGMIPTITSANDSKHMVGSKHYSNQALDLRTQDLPEQQKDLIFIALKNKLNPLGYDVIFEGRKTLSEHIHVEFDPKEIV